MERGAFFRHFCVSTVTTTAHTHKSGVIFHIFPRAFKQRKIKDLPLKMTKIASRGSCHHELYSYSPATSYSYIATNTATSYIELLLLS